MGSCSSTLTVSPRKLRASIKRRAAGRRLVKVRKTHSLKKEEKAFLRSNPTFENTAVLDRLRTIEYPTLDKEGHIYLDYTGGGLYAESQLRTHYDLLRRSVFGNPHSLSPTSSAITELDERARDLVLTYFNASPDEYTVVFTANASNALKLLGESYPFGPGGEMLLLWDNHNSVHGIREFARRKGAKSTYIPVTLPELRADEAVVEAALDSPGEKSDVPRLFAYPAQSNFSGTQHPLEWIEKAQSRGWDVLLDAAAFVPTNRLDLAHWKPDFVPVSFYKMFGYPSGVGCLIARKDTLARLSRPWFAGGTVWGVTVQSQGHVLLEGNSGFEDGTINYLSLPAVEIGLHHISRLGIDTIHERVLCLTNWLLKTLEPIRHSNGLPVVIVYGPPDTTRRGGTISFNFIDPTGRVIDERIVEQRAASIHLSLRTGCFCNPGAGEAAFRLTQEMLLRAFNEAERSELEFGVKKQWDDFLADMGMPTGGAIRISLGLMSNFADVYRFVQFACSFIDNIPKERDLVPRLHC